MLFASAILLAVGLVLVFLSKPIFMLLGTTAMMASIVLLVVGLIRTRRL